MATAISALKQPEQQAVARKPKTIYDLLMDDKAKTAIGAIAGKFMTPERFLRLAINCVKKTPRLLECDPQSVLGSFMASAALGLEPNTVLQQAYLIPYGVRGPLNDGSGKWDITHYDCQFQIGYRGFITLAHRSPHIITLEAEAIHEGDHFDHLKGSRSFLEYRKALKNRGELIGSFAFSKLEGGGESATVLPLDEINKIRSRSETYQSLIRKVDAANGDKKVKEQKKLNDTPWVMWEDDMSAKSAIKKHSKQLPMNPGDAMAAAVSLDAEREDGKTIDMADLADVEKMRAVMEDGDTAAVGDEPAAALTNEQGGETLDFGNVQQREKVDVGHFNAQQRNEAKQQATDVQPTTKGDPAVSNADELEGAINAETNADALDLLADHIRSLPAKDQPRLSKAYRARVQELSNGVASTQQASFSME